MSIAELNGSERFLPSAIGCWLFEELLATRASQGAQRRIRNKVVVCDLQRNFVPRTANLVPVVERRIPTANTVKERSSGKSLSVFPRKTHLPEHWSFLTAGTWHSACLSSSDASQSSLRLRCFNIDIDQLTLPERVLTDRSNDPSA